ncbi:NAD-dependent epimerase/dehydratase family protein [Marinomonas sp. C2222]|uniref:NAD-dependent epimerase/dehydratase family protein n=1 Tax=Marinomonas sargassi TaxID=2984494 RepID=A0ABT2YUF2_9GAMM|nr:NAD-dependent epimerase/dehydratase family protein [Marinomonas sargassi]MCV2403521.1 NAD-dependent epimerase/dehydratase family protein [Marinomonas sargassi]
MCTRVLVIGSCGQIGTELTQQLRLLYGDSNVIASDIKFPTPHNPHEIFEHLDVLDNEKLSFVIEKHKITDVYLMAAMLSATAEKSPEAAWSLNMQSLLHVLELARNKKIKKVFWPSSIAVFGPTTPKENTPQFTITEPTTVYGISKLSGERWCEYYHQNYDVDVRSIRYPGIISWLTPAGGGTTDYAVDIYHEAFKSSEYNCFLSANTKLPMMYMEDAIKAAIVIMQAPKENIRVRSSYNLSAMSFTPTDIANEISKYFPNFKVTYSPDFRQRIADSWPSSIDDSHARDDWGWRHSFDILSMSNDIITNLKTQSSKAS